MDMQLWAYQLQLEEKERQEIKDKQEILEHQQILEMMGEKYVD